MGVYPHAALKIRTPFVGGLLGDVSVPGQTIVDDISAVDPITAERVAFVNMYATPANGMVAPHIVIPFKKLLLIPAAKQFADAAGADDQSKNRHGAAYLLGVALATIYTGNLRMSDVVSERTFKQYESLLSGSKPEKYSSQVAQVNAALSKKVARDGLTAGQAQFAAGLMSGAETYTLCGLRAGRPACDLASYLLTNPDVALTLGGRLGAFVESFANASAASGQTQIQQTYTSC